jgi:acyl carrier protein
VAPSDLQAQIAAICAEILDRPTIGMDDDLIALGMDSVAAVEIVTRVESAFGGADVVEVIFDNPTAGHLCEVVQEFLRDGAVDASHP